MNKVFVVNFEDLDVVVQSGVMCKQFNIELCVIGFMFIVDSGVDVMLGGMVVMCVFGMNIVCYGIMWENILVLEVVLVDGIIIEIGICVWKFLVGYDLIKLLIGLEGIFGIIIKLIVWFYGQLEVILVVICVFFFVDDVVNLVIFVI